ncbi:MAG: MYXO-CTERM sorting domain-containing protein [Planctomycetota bacterium]|jgi:MYXO-CTERM domain-containing protein
MKADVRLLAPAGAVVAMLLQSASAAIITGVPKDDFAGSTIEMFSVDNGLQNTWDFGNGMVYSNLVGQSDLIGYTGGYGMGNGPGIDGGIDGPGTGYFGTNQTPTTFELVFAGGVSHFGFWGAESHVDDGSAGRNAELELEFYNTSGGLIDVIFESTPFDTHAWDQWHGFMSDGALIGKVIYRGAGHMVMDNVQFLGQPAPGALAFLGLGLLAARRRRRH